QTCALPICDGPLRWWLGAREPAVRPLYARPTAQPRPCQRREAGGDGTGATAAKKPGGAQAPHLRHSALCGGAAVLYQAVFPSHHGLLAAICEELCPELERRL